MNDRSAQHRTRLEQVRAATRRRVTRLTQSFEEIVSVAADAATDDEHDPEGHTIAWERQQVAALLDKATVALAELGDAEARLDAGSYGVCVKCSSDIGPDRLQALPAISTCISCAGGTIS